MYLPLRRAAILLAACIHVVLLMLPAHRSAGGTGDATLAAHLRKLDSEVLEDPWHAIHTLDILQPAISEAPPALQLRHYLHRSHALLWLYRQDELRAALESAQSLAGQHASDREKLFLLVLEGIVQRRDVAYLGSRQTLELARDRALEVDDQQMLTMALTELAFTRSLMGHHETALVELQEAWALASGLGDRFLVAMVEETLGAVYGYIDEYPTSIRYYQKALDAYTSLGFRAYQAEALNGLGITHRLAGNWEQAIAYFGQYREITEHNQSAHNRFVAAYGLGMTQAERGDCPAALAAIEEALQAGGPADFRAELLKRQAVCLAGQGEAERARAALHEARDIFQGTPELLGTRWHLDVQRAEALTLQALGEHAEAFQRLLGYHESLADLLARENSERVMELRVSMEGVRKDMEIDLLRQQARADALELEQRDRRLREQRLLTTGLIVLFLMVALIVLLQWRNARRLHQLSTRDGLTGLYNRRHLFGLLERLIQRLPVERGQLSVILLDVDDFKLINDRHGHPVGDRWLKAIAELAAPLLRGGDSMGRLGGEEFLVVLPRADREQARQVAQRLVERIRAFRLPLADGHQVSVTVSVGVASFGPDNPDLQSLYSAADRALYAAKSRGKDQVAIADGDSSAGQAGLQPV